MMSYLSFDSVWMHGLMCMYSVCVISCLCIKCL